MTGQTALMLVVFLACAISACDWWYHGEVATGWAFFFFGCGDACLAVEFMKSTAPFGG